MRRLLALVFTRVATVAPVSCGSDGRLRAQVPVDPVLVAESTAVVSRQRAVLIQVIAALWPTVSI